ncbi:hypothetical protein F4806DRAFT_223058 [Annulohypoxylon nitens]|nr:hypothetical protein F4806DRAFT_223058 [Annulohypoxylon nitens]
MPQRAKPIPAHVWSKHRAQITELRKTNTDDNVRAIMKNKFDFDATPAQYEARFREWGLFKYNIQRRAQPVGGQLQVFQSEESVSNDHNDTSETQEGHVPESESELDTAVADDQDAMDVVEPDSPLHGLDDMSIQTPLPTNGYPFGQQTWLRPPSSSQVIARFILVLYSKGLATPATNALSVTSDSIHYQFSNATTEATPFSRGLASSTALETLHSSQIFTKEDWSLLKMRLGNVTDECLFDGKLITSAINGFAGLENTPAISILKLLGRHQAAEQAMLYFLSNAPRPLAKSLAESIFPAYLQVDNVAAIQTLHKYGFIDINEAVCRQNGGKYTPLESAAISQSFDVLKYLINQRVDVNKSFSRAPHHNALHLLIQYASSRQTLLSDIFVGSVEALLEAKITILTDTIQSALWFTDSRLAISLIKNLASKSPQTLISHKGLLRRIVKYLERPDATSSIKLIVDKCQELGKVHYMHQYALHIDHALDLIMEKGYEESAEILIQYASSPNRQLQAAIEAGNGEVIKVVRRQLPGLYEDLRFDMDEESENFISALKSGNQECLFFLEENGVLNRLQGHRLGRTLTAALEAANLVYATKIMNFDPEFKFYDPLDESLEDSQRFNVAAALSAALAHPFFDQIAWQLLAIGVTSPTPYYRDHNNRPAPLLYIAMERKKWEFVRAIIEFGFDPNILEGVVTGYPILELAIEYGDNSIIDDLWRARPNTMFPSERLFELALEKNREDIFVDLVKSSYRIHDSSADEALEVAVKFESQSALDALISIHVKADNDGILEEAMENHPAMVDPLLKYYKDTYPEGREGYGYDLVANAIDNYSTSPELLERLYEWGLVHSNVHFKGYCKDETLLIRAIKTRNFEVVKILVDAGSNVNDTVRSSHSSGHGMKTPLLKAIATGDQNIVNLLIRNKAEVNEPAQFGIRRTPLQRAVEKNDISMVNSLILEGADVNALPAIFNGATALQLAAIQGNIKMANLLIHHGALPSIRPPLGVRGRWPLEGAAEHGRFDMIEFLWGAPGSFIDNEQVRRAMRLAEINGHGGCKLKIQELAMEFPRNGSLLM